jgi:hypothetical protein
VDFAYLVWRVLLCALQLAALLLGHAALCLKLDGTMQVWLPPAVVLSACCQFR